MEEYKKEYVFVLQSCVRVPIREHSSCDNMQVKLFGGDIVSYAISVIQQSVYFRFYHFFFIITFILA